MCSTRASTTVVQGLPISGETVLSLANKERVEFLKGTSGIQASTSAPGGLVNYIVKRPTAQPLRRVRLGIGDRGSVGAALDLGGRAGVDDRFGYRLNLAHEDRNPQIEDYGRTRSHLAAFAADWRLDSDAVIDAEIEWSRQTGSSLPGFSLRGDTLPPARAHAQPQQPALEPAQRLRRPHRQPAPRPGPGRRLALGDLARHRNA